MLMKKYLLTFASVLAISSAVATTASARDGFYFAARGGITNYNLNDKDDKSADKARVDFDDVMMAAGAFGYRYSYLRIEGEYTYREDQDNEYTITGFNGKNKATLESSSIMANAYLDFMPNYWISPFISAGLGVTSLDMTNQDTSGDEEKWSADNFTWSVGAGLTLRLNKCVNFDAAYRYLDMGDIDKSNMNSHEYYAGLRFTF